MRPSLARLLVLLAAVVTPAAAAAQTAAPTTLRGDVNGDGQVTVLDAIAVLTYVVGRPLPAGYRMDAADADGNGTVTTMDALVIASYAAGRDVSRFPVGTPIQASVRADAISCAVSAAAGTLACRAPDLRRPAGVNAVVLGGQNVFVRLTSSNPHFDPATRLFKADVRVTNLLAQTLGLGTDGAPNPSGIRVFFNQMSSAAVAVMNADGSETFLAPEQPFYQYDGPLAPGDSTPAKQWSWHLPEGVDNFTFRVYADGQVQYPGDNTNQGDLAHEREQGVRLLLVSGGGQTGAPGQPLPQPIIVRVVDQDGRPWPDAVVNFLATDGSADPRQTRTDTAGYARATWTLGSAPGPQELRVSGVGGTLVVTANAVAPPVVASVTVSPDSLVLMPGGTGTFTATARDAGGNPVAGTATWTSSDTAVAKVDAMGKVTAVAAGSVTITATIAGVSGTAKVRVKAPAPGPVARVVVSPDPLLLYVNEVKSFTATAYDAAGQVVPNPGTYRWTSSDSNYVRLVDFYGRVRGNAPGGEVTISATVAGVTGTATARVGVPSPPRVTWILMRNATCCGNVDLSSGLQRVNYEIDVSGYVGTMAMTIRSPSGELIPCSTPDADDETGHRSWLCSLEIPAGSTPGVWVVDHVTLDGRVVNAAGLDSTWVPGRRFDVFGSGTDTAPPQIRSVVPELSSGVRYLKFGVRDHLSGVSTVSAVVYGPGGQHQTCTATSTNGPVPKSSDWICRLNVAPGSGRWGLESVTVTDAAGNSRTYTPADIEPIRGVFEYTFLWFEFDA